MSASQVNTNSPVTSAIYSPEYVPGSPEYRPVTPSGEDTIIPGENGIPPLNLPKPLDFTGIDEITEKIEDMTINKKGLFGYKKTKVLHGLPAKLRESFFQRRLREGNNSTDLNYLLHLCDLLIPSVTERSRAKRWLKENTENPNFSQFEKQFFK